MNHSVDPTTGPTPHGDGSMRLSKRMAELGLASRREADEWISRGWVFVDGVKTDVLGSKVLPHQKITVSRAAKEESDQRVTVLINKPIGYVSGQAEDGYKPASTLIVPAAHWSEDPRTLPATWRPPRGLAPAGRLDIDSTGLLVLTEDGRIARHLIGQDSQIEKEYLVRVAGTLSDVDLRLLQHGLSIDGVPLKPARVAWQNQEQLRFVLREGKKRQIRRMCELVGLRVIGLKRVRVGGVMLGDLPLGQWRYLDRGEAF
jgi:23S rRNA pseudouridine2604 synthase